MDNIPKENVRSRAIIDLDVAATLASARRWVAGEWSCCKQQHFHFEMGAAVLIVGSSPDERTSSLGGPLNERGARADGDIDIDPIPTKTAPRSVLVSQNLDGTNSVLNKIRPHHEGDFDRTWLKSNSINNSFAIDLPRHPVTDEDSALIDAIARKKLFAIQHSST